MPQRNILVTGGAGNVGGSLCSKLVESPDNFVIVVDNLSTGSADKLPPAEHKNWKFIKADVNDIHQISAIMLSHRVNVVFHYAAVVGVERTLANPVSVLHDIAGIQNVLEISKNSGVERVFYSSSSEVYGEPVEIPQHEHTTPLNSRLPYAIVKNVGEAYCRSYFQEYGLNHTVLRFFNTYGPRQSDDFVVPRFIKAALRGEPLRIYGDGSQTRTFCYADDNVETIVRMLDDNLCLNEVVNVGNDEEVSILELAQKVVRITGSKSVIEHLPPLKEGDMTRRKPDITKMKSILNRPLIGIDEGISRLADSMRT